MTGIQKAIWWAEWQANNLAPRIVMPRTIFLDALQDCYDKDRKAFASDLKTIYHASNEEKAGLALDRVTEKWTMSIRNWGQVYGELSIMYEGRLPE